MRRRDRYTYERPHRTLFMRLYNRVGGLLRRCGWRRPVTVEAILHSARRVTGLSDFGSERFLEPLRILVESFEGSARMNSIGRLVVHFTLRNLAVNRLRIQQALKDHPAIRAQNITRPLFIVGLPRTGTTLLFHLLSQDRRYRPLLLWEAGQPALPRPPRPGKKDPRIAAARRVVWMMNHRLAPQLRTVHALEAEGPEECTLMLFNTFVSPAFSLYGNLDAYVKYLRQREREDRLHAYREYREMLQLLQWQAPSAPGRWLLKSPAHAWALDALLALFPDACVIQTHRSMAQVIPSTCSMMAILHGMVTDDVQRARLGPLMAQGMLTDMLEPALRARAEYPGRIFDVRYSSLIDDPLGTVAAIYRHFGLEMEDDQRTRMAQWLAGNPIHKHGVHRYDLEQFGLSRGEVDALFAEYEHRFELAPEPMGV